MIKFLQINLERSPGAHDLAEVTIKNKKVDIIVASEPNKKYLDKEGWFMDGKRDSALKVFSKKLKVFEWGKGEGYVWIGLHDIQIFSCYISPNVHISKFVSFLNGIKAEIRLSKINVSL